MIAPIPRAANPHPSKGTGRRFLHLGTCSYTGPRTCDEGPQALVEKEMEVSDP